MNACTLIAMLDVRPFLVICLVASLAWSDPSPGDINININPRHIKDEGRAVQEVSEDAKLTPALEFSESGHYLGCFSDTSPRILPVLAYANQQNSIEKCKAACKAKDILIAVVQFRCMETGI